MKKSKGFTLVELLAVIVILAVLVLFATPAVTSIMQKAQKNSFKQEIVGMVKSFETAFAEKSASMALAQPANDDNVTQNKIYNITIGSVKYKYLCMTLADLVGEQYVKKSLNGYGGYIQTWVPDDSTKPTVTFINATNSNYVLQGRYDKVIGGEHLASTSANSSVPDPATAKCTGKIAQSLPAADVFNAQ